MKRRRDCLTPIILFFGICLILAGGLELARPGILVGKQSVDQQRLTGAERGLPIFQSLAAVGGQEVEFSQDGRNVYYLLASGELVQFDLDRGSVAGLPTEMPLLAHLTWDPAREHALVEWLVDIDGRSALDMFDLETLQRKNLSMSAWGADWLPGGQQIAYLNRDENGVGVWLADTDGDKARKILDVSDIAGPGYVDWSPQGNRFIVQGATGAEIYSFLDNYVIEVNWLPLTREAIWSPDGWQIVYRRDIEQGETLWKSNQDGNQETLVLEGVFSQLHWLPDRRMVYFTPGNKGGAACWALHLVTGSKELLADASIVYWKPVGDFAVSPQGDRIVFEAQDGQMWLLRLSP